MDKYYELNLIKKEAKIKNEEKFIEERGSEHGSSFTTQ